MDIYNISFISILLIVFTILVFFKMSQKNKSAKTSGSKPSKVNMRNKFIKLIDEVCSGFPSVGGFSDAELDAIVEKLNEAKKTFDQIKDKSSVLKDVNFKKCSSFFDDLGINTSVNQKEKVSEIKYCFLQFTIPDREEDNSKRKNKTLITLKQVNQSEVVGEKDSSKEDKTNMTSRELSRSLENISIKIDNKMKVLEDRIYSIINEKINEIKKVFTYDMSKNFNDLGQVNRELSANVSKNINNLKSVVSSQSIPNDYLKKSDLTSELNRKLNSHRDELVFKFESDLRELKEIGEEMDTLPKKIDDIDKKLSTIDESIKDISTNSAGGASNSGDIPKEERAIRDLHKYMSDGMRQLESLSLSYVSNVDNINNIDKLKEEHKAELSLSRQQAFNEGRRGGVISLVKSISEKFPSVFRSIESVFSEVLKYEFIAGDILEITNDNKNELIRFIDADIKLGDYKIVTPAILLSDNSVVVKAKVELLSDDDSCNSSIKTTIVSDDSDTVKDSHEYDKSSECNLEAQAGSESDQVDDNSSHGAVVNEHLHEPDQQDINGKKATCEDKDIVAPDTVVADHG